MLMKRLPEAARPLAEATVINITNLKALAQKGVMKDEIENAL